MKRRSDEEAVKDAGLTLDFDEIARKGSMSREEASIAKWYGIYHSRQPGSDMARVVIPGGKMTSVEARTLAKLSAVYPPQRISFTTRQSAQLHCLKLKDLPQFLRDLAAAGMTTFHGCGDVTRNVAACPWASICPHRRLDVLPFAQQTAERIGRLPRTGQSAAEVQNHLFRLPGGMRPAGDQLRRRRRGATAAERRRARRRGSASSSAAAWVGRRSSPSRSTASSRRSGSSTFAAPPAFFFRDHGDRRIRMYARLKFVVHRLGIDRCRQAIDEILDRQGVDRRGSRPRPRRTAARRCPTARCPSPTRAAPTAWPSSRSRFPRAS